MAVKNVNELKRILFGTYEGFADKRLKNLDKGNYFIVDDRRDADYDARGDLFLWFCQIGLTVDDDHDKVTLTLRGGVPDSAKVAAWLEKMGAKKTAFATEVEIAKGNEDDLMELASAFRAIVRPGARYDVKAYKYVCPRAAAALTRLRDTLHEAWVG
jgi:D-ribose pyranose/furanose isomerase RbsD